VRQDSDVVGRVQWVPPPSHGIGRPGGRQSQAPDTIVADVHAMTTAMLVLMIVRDSPTPTAEADQPRIGGLPRTCAVRHYLGLHRAERRLTSLLADFRWTTISRLLAGPSGE
jgi:hypothetical protein